MGATRYEYWGGRLITPNSCEALGKAQTHLSGEGASPGDSKDSYLLPL